MVPPVRPDGQRVVTTRRGVEVLATAGPGGRHTLQLR
jgi:hypothetical protein